MSTIFNQELKIDKAPVGHHPWEKIVKPSLSNRIKHVHNSVTNPVYPKAKEVKQNKEQIRVQLTVVGDRCARAFIYCKKLVEGLFKYRSKYFKPPKITGVSSVEWPHMVHDMGLKFGGLSFTPTDRVMVLFDGQYLGGEKELKELIETRFFYEVHVDYPKEAVDAFINFVNSTGRTFVYLIISIDGEVLGPLIFMLYNDIVPLTCENFIRLCTTKLGGYAGTPIHRIVKDCWIQGGGFNLKNSDLSCENFIVPHDKRGVLCMANDGRHLDCSTQFFVLLNPAEWMKHKYVAFGQLVDGENILRQIESVDTWYEAPKKDIIILRSGLLSFTCPGIAINPNARHIIYEHTEDLVELGEFLMNDLMSRVLPNIGLDLEQRKYDDKDIRATKRFLIDKQEIDRKTAGSRSSGDRGENNEFDVEDYSFIPEEQSSYARTPPPSNDVVGVKARPYYLPLTDLTYPEDVDSTDDLKKFLTGDYCLASELVTTDENINKENYNMELAELIADVYKDVEPAVHEEAQLDDGDEQEIRDYLWKYADIASFGGDTIKNIVMRTYDLPKTLKNLDEVLTDEDLRRLRMIKDQVQNRREKAVSIVITPRDILPQFAIHRRATEFVKQDIMALSKCAKPEKIESKESEPPEYEVFKQIYQLDKFEMKIIEPVRNIRADDKGTTRESDAGGMECEENNHDAEEAMEETPSFTTQPDRGSKKKEFKIQPLVEETHERKMKRRQTGMVTKEMMQKFHMTDEDDDDSSDSRNVAYESDSGKQTATDASTLNKLYNRLPKLHDGVPTLKDYKPMSELLKKKLLLLSITSPTDISEVDEQNIVRIEDKRQLLLDSPNPVPRTQVESKKPASVALKKKKESEVFNLNRQSLRSVEYAKTRPYLTVSEYQLQNQQYQEQFKEENADHRLSGIA